MSPVKVPFEVMALEVDKLYPPHYNLKPGETVEEHCAFIAQFIQACGYTEEEYLDLWFAKQRSAAN